MEHGHGHGHGHGALYGAERARETAREILTSRALRGRLHGALPRPPGAACGALACQVTEAPFQTSSATGTSRCLLAWSASTACMTTSGLVAWRERQLSMHSSVRTRVGSRTIPTLEVPSPFDLTWSAHPKHRIAAPTATTHSATIQSSSGSAGGGSGGGNDGGSMPRSHARNGASSNAARRVGGQLFRRLYPDARTATGPLRLAAGWCCRFRSCERRRGTLCSSSSRTARRTTATLSAATTG